MVHNELLIRAAASELLIRAAASQPPRVRVWILQRPSCEQGGELALLARLRDVPPQADVVVQPVDVAHVVVGQDTDVVLAELVLGHLDLDVRVEEVDAEEERVAQQVQRHGQPTWSAHCQRMVSTWSAHAAEPGAALGQRA